MEKPENFFVCEEFLPLEIFVKAAFFSIFKDQINNSFLFINNLIGLGVGPLLMGAISDWLKTGYGTESLRYAAVSCLGFYLLAALLALLSVRALRRDWVAEAPAG